VRHDKFHHAVVDPLRDFFSTTEWCRYDRSRRQHATADKITTFDEERELTGGQLHRVSVITPKRGEATALEALLENA
jgi:hypothetical protein